MTTPSLLQRFIQAMEPYSMDKMDDFFNYSQREFYDHPHLVNFTKMKTLAQLLGFSLLGFVFFSVLFFNDHSIDWTTRLISVCLFGSLFSIGMIFYAWEKTKKRFEFMKEQAFEDLMHIKEKFFYQENSIETFFSSIPNAKKFFGSDKFTFIQYHCKRKSLSTKELYFLLTCAQYESMYGAYHSVNEFKTWLFNIFKAKMKLTKA